MVKFTNLMSLGYSVIPVDKGSKRPLVPWLEYQERQAREREIWWWNKRFPECNVGIVTGSISGIVVLDIDSRDGYEEAKRRGLPRTPCVTTGKGLHYYFAHPGTGIRNFAKRIPGIDLRADGGYVVAPGSLHPERETYYEWRAHPDDVSYAPLPRWILTLIEKKEEITSEQVDAVAKMLQTKIEARRSGSAYGNKAYDLEMARLAATQEGGRNNTLFRVAIRMFELSKAGEVDEHGVIESLNSLAQRIGLRQTETRRTINSAYNKATPKPRPKE